jgi:ABC-type transport system involved in multi-copper enzyme maturation permease subunit
MSTATALTVIVLASRQLPREFQNRTIYPLLAKPVTRFSFLLGKLAGVVLAGAFCFLLFMVVYVGGAWYLGQGIPWGLFLQYIYLQLVMLAMIAALCFWLSLLLNLDAAITIGVIFYLTSATIGMIISELYSFADELMKWVLVVLNYILPNLALFDLSEKAVHAGAVWGPLPLWVMAGVSAYGAFWGAVYFSLALWWFRRKPL